jgi:hypothetical protein
MQRRATFWLVEGMTPYVNWFRKGSEPSDHETVSWCSGCHPSCYGIPGSIPVSNSAILIEVHVICLSQIIRNNDDKVFPLSLALKEGHRLKEFQNKVLDKA